MTHRLALFFSGVALLIASSDSYAYLDPGTGSVLIQGLIATIAAAGFTARLYWHKIATFFKRSDKKKVDESDKENDIVD